MGNVVQGVTQSGAGGLAAGLVANQQEGATNQGNIFSESRTGNAGMAQEAAGSIIGGSRGGDGYSGFQDQVRNGGITSQLYGQGGALGNAIGQYNNLQANPGLTAQDNTAYGQASGQIANQFGAQQNSIAQAMANRGMSNSGAAGAAFSGSFGNQQEQLGQLQTQIAQNREMMNTQRMGQLQNFISQLGQGANQATGQAMQGGQNAYNNAMGYLNAQQGQSNAQLDQMNKTAHASTLGNAMAGLSGGMNAANSSGGSGSQQAMQGYGNGSMGGYAGADASGSAADSSSMFA
jgi:hypothetical protein